MFAGFTRTHGTPCVTFGENAENRHCDPQTTEGASSNISAASDFFNGMHSENITVT